MIKETKIAPQNSLLLIMSNGGGEIPLSMANKLVVATPSCIAVGTLSQIDGETSVTLTDEPFQPEMVSGLQKVFSGILETPSKSVSVCTVVLDPILTLPLQKTKSTVEIWADSDAEPDELYIIVT
jgi:hypothetical protein